MSNFLSIDGKPFLCQLIGSLIITLLIVVITIVIRLAPCCLIVLSLRLIPPLSFIGI